MKDWWKKSVFYQIYMPSFYDGNGDGIGDFIGITKKLSYLKSLGIDAIWITPFYKSPKIDNGYDIEDYYEIDDDYGTMEDFEDFIKEAHRLDIKVIADLVLNHTSSKHRWFIESRSSIDNPKRDWYIWRKSKGDSTPNNWESFFEGSAWEYDNSTKEYYYHAFAKEQVDLNWNNKEVRHAMYEVMSFWLEKGIDGFRLDVINFLKVNEKIIDNPSDSLGKQIHAYDKDQEGILEVISEIRELMDSYDDKFLVGEIGSEELQDIKAYVGDDKLHTTFNFNLGSMKEFNLEKFYTEIKAMQDAYKDDLPTLFFGSHDMGRFPSRFHFNENEIKLISTFLLTYRGIPFIYFGEEIGMRDLICTDIHEMKDVQGRLSYIELINQGKSAKEALKIANERNRDKSRSPMQWDGSKFAGFSRNTPWINVGKDNLYNNVEYQAGKEDSVLSYYTDLIKLRKESPALNRGECTNIVLEDKVIYYVRKYAPYELLILLNFNNEKKYFNSINLNEYSLVKSNKSDTTFKEDCYLQPYEGIILIKY